MDAEDAVIGAAPGAPQHPQGSPMASALSDDLARMGLDPVTAAPASSPGDSSGRDSATPPATRGPRLFTPAGPTPPRSGAKPEPANKVTLSPHNQELVEEEGRRRAQLSAATRQRNWGSTAVQGGGSLEDPRAALKLTLSPHDQQQAEEEGRRRAEQLAATRQRNWGTTAVQGGGGFSDPRPADRVTLQPHDQQQAEEEARRRAEALAAIRHRNWGSTVVQGSGGFEDTRTKDRVTLRPHDQQKAEEEARRRAEESAAIRQRNWGIAAVQGSAKLAEAEKAANQISDSARSHEGAGGRQQLRALHPAEQYSWSSTEVWETQRFEDPRGALKSNMQPVDMAKVEADARRRAEEAAAARQRNWGQGGFFQDPVTSPTAGKVNQQAVDMAKAEEEARQRAEAAAAFRQRNRGHEGLIG